MSWARSIWFHKFWLIKITRWKFETYLKHLEVELGISGDSGDSGENPWRKPLALRVFQAVPCEFPDEMMLSPKRPGLGWRQRALSRTEPHGTDDRVMWYNELQPDHAIPIISIQFSSVDIIHEVLYLTASTNKIQIPETYHYWLSAPLSRQDRDIIDIQLVRASQSCLFWIIWIGKIGSETSETGSGESGESRGSEGSGS
jgi:hypothetical protein